MAVEELMLMIFIGGVCLIIGSAPLLWAIDDAIFRNQFTKKNGEYLDYLYQSTEVNKKGFQTDE